MEDNKIPYHVAIIMDGNGRWAKERGKVRSYGHEMGAKTLKELALYAFSKGVKVLSVFAFSTENFKRSEEEVGFLMNLFIKLFNTEFKIFNEKDIKVVFMGTPSFAVPILESLIEKTNVVMVVTQPDREKDRKGNIIYSPCKELALKNNIEVFQPIKIKEEYQKVLDTKPDIIVTAAYGQIIPSVILDYPKYGCINVHGSLLPKLRGGAPVHHAIINGDKVAGVTIMYMDKKMDAGDIISQKSTPIHEDTTLDELYNRLSYLGRDLLIETLPSIIDGTNNRVKQNEDEVTFGYNITKEEEKVNFNDNIDNIHNKIRGLSSIPGAYANINNKRMKIYKSEKTNIKSNKEPGTIVDINSDGIYVTTLDYVIKLIDIKLEGKKRCLVKDFINGIKKEEYIGEVFE